MKIPSRLACLSALILPPIGAAAMPGTTRMPAPSRGEAPSSRSAVRSVAAATSAATAEPGRSGFLDAAQVFAYSEGALYHGYAAPGRITDIMLEPGETLGAVAAGDTVRWVIGDTVSGTGTEKRAHVLVKPTAPSLATSLVITTDRRSYHLVFTSTPAVAITAISWNYPHGAMLAIEHAAAPSVTGLAVPAGQGVDPARLSFDYALSGDAPSWRPVRVFDDGRQTFIEFPPTLATGEAPPLFVLGPGGSPDLVNFRQRGRFYIVDRLFDAAELRMGLKPQLVVRIVRRQAPASVRTAS